jgi:hypothetical protein
MRRFLARPSGVSLDATGLVSPNPFAFSRLGFTPCDWKKATTYEARFSDRSVLLLIPMRCS